MGFQSLPNELLDRIAYHADHESLLNLRLVCQSLSDICRKWLFQYTCVVPTDESCERFESILDHPELASCVTKVYLDTTKWDHEIEIEEYDSDDEDIESDSDGDEESDKHHVNEIWIPRWYSNLFNRLEELPRLRGVVLRFHHECQSPLWVEMMTDIIPQEPNFRRYVLKLFMESLALLPQPVRELGIHDLQNVNQSKEHIVENIRKVLGGLDTLRLNIANEHSKYYRPQDLQQDEPHRFFSELPSFWLKPTLANLEHLTLNSSNYFGFYPKFNPTGLHFPRIKTLAFGRLAFIHDSQLDWILSHADTLTELYLDNCPILYEVLIHDKERTYLDPASFASKEDLGDKHYATYDKRWYDYFNAINVGLPLLKHFRFGRCPYWRDGESTPFEQEQYIKISAPRDRYMVFCDGGESSPYMETTIYPEGVNLRTPRPDCYAEDQKALETLCAKLGQHAECDPIEDEFLHP
ncbi:hypothetical protein P170DRAFT_467718 [Aspergillus steynii IBT 23096]|uniref:F-box domain-containing protein n=1 Tax=Aspergillus steynii IBT 23096 TaxID=1392250 RepID=A0A2I2FWY1_9EURO|nr:uncharacterized protein P170DRAFT_467718 [Aspergillus steynii IBT 23096]PLB45143.1 hypothetical protein P170DRAFT_467718 [Aspergillus steynii IBT 23096]